MSTTPPARTDRELDVVRHVLRTLADGAERALAAGIPPERILVDPTLDFGKTTRHSPTSSPTPCGLPSCGGTATVSMSWSSSTHGIRRAMR